MASVTKFLETYSCFNVYFCGSCRKNCSITTILWSLFNFSSKFYLLVFKNSQAILSFQDIQLLSEVRTTVKDFIERYIFFVV